MTARTPFRFGVVAAAARSGADWLDRARQIEALGFATMIIPDGMRYTLAPLPALAAAAAVTTTLRVGTYVLANDFRNPVLLAKEAATLDVLSGGRFELGLGAGRPDARDDNRLLGLPFESGARRMARLAQSVQAIKRAWQPDAEVGPRPVQQPHPPIMIAGSGDQMLALAAREADIVALGLGPTATVDEARQRIEHIERSAGDRFEKLELNLNLMAVGDQVPTYLARQRNLTAEALAQAGAVSAATGSTDQIVDTLYARRDQLGISYFVVGDELMSAFAPVVARLAGQ